MVFFKFFTAGNHALDYKNIQGVLRQNAIVMFQIFTQLLLGIENVIYKGTVEF